MSTNAIPVARGCGTRKQGGLYAEVGMSGEGSPLEAFLYCPPVVLDTKRLGIEPLGVKLIAQNGVYHVFDWIGSDSYPSVTDFIEEMRRFGLSRRLPRTLDFSKLTANSKIVLLHARAQIDNFAEYAAQWIVREEVREGHPVPRCPKGLPEHDQTEAPAMCVGAYWQDVEGGEPLGLENPRAVRRQMPSFSYNAFARPAGVQPKYQPAMFAAFPLTRLVAVKGTAEEDAANVALLNRSQLPSDLVAE